jgi:rubredoxin
MSKWKCTVCEYIYDEEDEGTKFEDLPDDWVCPACGVGKEEFIKEEE